MKFFVSYAHADRGFAERLATTLEDAGQSVWTNREILPGDNWAVMIAKALDEAEAMVAVVSPEAMTSDFVSREWDYALGQEKFENRLIPVEVRPTPGKPWIFNRLKTLRASTPEDAGRQILSRLGLVSRTARARARASS